MVFTIFTAIAALYGVFIVIKFFKNEKKFKLNRGLYRKVLYTL